MGVLLRWRNQEVPVLTLFNENLMPSNEKVTPGGYCKYGFGGLVDLLGWGATPDSRCQLSS
jgi:hypothetical protein